MPIAWWQVTLGHPLAWLGWPTVSLKLTARDWKVVYVLNPIEERILCLPSP